MKNILFIITKSEVGGAQTWVKEQAQLFENDFNSFLITNKPGWLSQYNFKSSLFLPEIERIFSIFCYIKIIVFIKNYNIDVIVASSANAGIYARLVKLFTGCRIIYVSHGWSCIYNGGKFKKFYILIERFLSFLTDRILCVSDYDYHAGLSIIKINKSKLLTIRNRIFPRMFNDEFNSTSSQFRVLFLGRLAYPKRPDLLIEALSNIDNVTLDIVGDGPDLAYLKAKFPFVNFLGNIPNFNSFPRYDLFALISESEGLPMSALEAGSAGLPLLLSNVGGCGELIVNKNGELVANNHESIASSIKLIINNYDTYKTAALSVIYSFDIRNKKDCYIKLYNK